MKTYLISYDLRIPETPEDYRLLIDAIKSLGGWATPLKSVWFVTTNMTTSEVRDFLKSEADYNDAILVIDVTNASWATKGVSDNVTTWMSENI